MTTNEAFVYSVIALTVDLLRYSEYVRQQVLAGLLQLEADLILQLQVSELTTATTVTLRVQRTKVLLAETQRTIQTAYKTARLTQTRMLFDLAEVASFQNVRLLNDVFSQSIGTTLTPTRLRNIASDVLVEGSPAKDWWSKQSNDLQQRTASQIRMGLAAGETNDQIVERLRGRATGRTLNIATPGKLIRVKEYAGGIFTGTNREAGALVITSAQAVANATYFDTYKQNQDVLRGVGAQVTLDLRTSDLCKSRSGGAWDFKGAPLPESRVNMRFPGSPPWHWRCRTVLVPILKSWDSILTDAPDTPEPSTTTQASMNGQVAGALSYEDWFRTRSPAEQREALGTARYKLWSGGKLSAVDLVDQTGNPLSLVELRARYGTS